MQKIVGVRRNNDRETYFFRQNIDDLSLGDKVVARFDEFETVVTVSKLGLSEQDDKAYELPKLERRASENDLARFESLLKKAKSKLPEVKKKSLELGLMMKFVSAEYSMDESKILITFSSEERVDFRQLLKEIASMLKARIELKQIGQRDEVKICGGVGPCGEQCCCTRFLKNFDHVTVKMAKVQGLSLAPTKINGICGRLMCCLGYEAEMYEQMLAKMPKVGSTIKGPNGEGTVVYNDILRERVSIKRQADGDTFIVEDFTLEELKNPKPKTEAEPVREVEQKTERDGKFQNKPEPENRPHEKHGTNKPHEKQERQQQKGKDEYHIEIIEPEEVIKPEDSGENSAQKKNFGGRKFNGNRRRHFSKGPKKDFAKK